MRRYNIIFLSVVGLVLMMILSLNIVTDYYGVIGLSRWNKRFYVRNDRYGKSQYLIRNPQRAIEGVIFGTSRANFYNAAVAGKLTGRDYYNFSTLSDELPLIRKKLEWLIKQRYPLKEAVFGIDFDYMFVTADPEVFKYRLLLFEHPALTGTSRLAFLMPYLMHVSLGEWKDAWARNRTPSDYMVRSYDFQRGGFYYDRADYLRDQDPDAYMREHFQNTEPLISNWTTVSRYLDEWQEIVTLARENGIRVICIVNPYNHRIFASFDPGHYARWLEAMVKITGEVWDFSGYNDVTSDNYRYYEDVHFDFAVGSEALLAVFEKMPVNAAPRPGQFAKRLTAENITEYIRIARPIWDRHAVHGGKKVPAIGSAQLTQLLREK